MTTTAARDGDLILSVQPDSTEDLLARGHVVAIFPEGHRSPTATLQRPHEGVVFLARRAKVPILPVAIWGTERLSLRTLWRRPRVHVAAGAPFQPQDLVVTLLGTYVRPYGDMVWSGGLVMLLGEFGFSQGAARVALTRLVRRGLIGRVRSGR